MAHLFFGTDVSPSYIAGTPAAENEHTPHMTSHGLADKMPKPRASVAPLLPQAGQTEQPGGAAATAPCAHTHIAGQD